MNHKVSYEVSVTGDGEQGFKRITKASAETRKSIAGMNKDLERMKKLREETTDSRRQHRLNAAIRETEAEIRKAEGATNALNISMGKMKAVGAASAVAVAAGMVKVGKSAIQASSQMEKYQVTLKTMLGSTKAAGERMAEYMDIAKITPFQLSEVVEGGNQLQAMGRYSRENLEMLGDLAAASGKPLQQVMGAYGKLASGQKGIAVDMFRDLLITTNDWVEATGKGVEKSGQLKASVEDMMAALPKIMEKKGFMGLMAAQAETTEGKISNLEDAVFSLSDAIGERMQPTVKSVVGWLSKLTGRMENAVRIPTVEKIAKEKVELNLLVGELIRTNEGEEDRKEKIDELNRKFPEFLKNINLETDANEQLRDKLAQVNREYDNRMKKAALQRRLDALEDSKADVMDDIVRYQIAQEAQKKLPGLRKKLGGVYEIMRQTKGEKSGDWDKKRKSYVWRDATPEERALYAEIKAYEDNLTWFGNDNKREEKAKRELQSLKVQEKIIRDMYDAVDSSEKGTAGDGKGGGSNGGNTSDSGGGTKEDEDTGGSYGGGTSGGGGSVSYGGGASGGGRNVTTKIGTLVGVININTTNLTEGAAEVKRLVAQALLEAIPSN